MVFAKTVRIGTAKTYNGRAYSIFCRITFVDGKLSITGVEGPTQGGNCLGACGQIEMHLADAQNTIKPAPGWNRGKLAQFFEIWRKYHLNDLQAGSPDQRAWLAEHRDEGHDKSPYYDWACKALADAGLNPDPNYPPEQINANGAVVKGGYKYGSAWLKLEIPADVLDFLRELPDTDRHPAWV